MLFRSALANAELALSHALNETVFDPAELERVEERLFALRAAGRKYNVSVEQLPHVTLKFADEIATLDASEARLMLLREASAQAQQAYFTAACKLSDSRQKACKRLNQLVDAELGPLRLDGARFMAQVSGDPQNSGPEGIDHIEFWVQTNPGARAGPLMKVASGGELARFMLALKAVLSDQIGRAHV